MTTKLDFTKALADLFSVKEPNGQDRAIYKSLIEDAIENPSLLDSSLLEEPLEIENHRLKCFYIRCVYGLFLKNNSAFEGFLTLHEAKTHPKHFDNRILDALEEALRKKDIRMDLLSAFWQVLCESVLLDFKNSGVFIEKTFELISSIFGFRGGYTQYLVADSKYKREKSTKPTIR